MQLRFLSYKHIDMNTPKESPNPYTFVWHFLENLNFEFKNILEYIRTMISGNTCLFVKTTDLELLKY